MDRQEAQEIKCSPLICQSPMVLFIRIETTTGPMFMCFCQKHLDRAVTCLTKLTEEVRVEA